MCPWWDIKIFQGEMGKCFLLERLNGRGIEMRCGMDGKGRWQEEVGMAGTAE